MSSQAVFHFGARAVPDPFARLAGDSAVVAQLRHALRRIARADATVLLRGETGTGKGLAARLLHDASPRAAAPFAHVDCAALAPSVIESELFGHERGAFTGADAARAGRLEAAARGTLFLDEIAELEPRLQAKLLRALQDRAFERVGGTRTLALGARVVAATHRDLRRAVAEGSFRADLYFRLQVCEVTLPPLRERLEDLPRAGRARARSDRGARRSRGAAHDRGIPRRARAPRVARQRARAGEPAGARRRARRGRRARRRGRGSRCSIRSWMALLQPRRRRTPLRVAVRRATRTTARASPPRWSRRAATSPARRAGSVSRARRCGIASIATGCGA